MDRIVEKVLVMDLTKYTKLKIMMQRQQDEYQKMKDEQKTQEGQITNTIDSLTIILHDIENIADISEKDLQLLISLNSNIEKYIKQLQFLRQNLGKENEKQVPQYQSIIKQLTDEIQNILKQQNEQLQAIQSTHFTNLETNMEVYQQLVNKIGVDGPLDKIDDETEIKLVKEMLGNEIFSSKERVSILKEIILYNANHYSEILTKQDQLESFPLLEESISLQETPISTLEPELLETIEDLLSQENKDLIENVKKILDEQTGNLHRTTDSYSSDKKEYETYYQELYIKYLISYLNDVQAALEEWKESQSLEDKKLYKELLQESLHELQEAYNSYQIMLQSKMKSQEVAIEKMTIFPSNQGKNVLFLLDENQNSYLLQDIEREDRGNIEAIKKAIVGMISSLRLGNIAPIRQSHSNEFYANYRIELYRKFTDLGLQDLAFYNLTNDTILLIGTDTTSKSETANSKSIDRTIASRVQDKRYVNTIQQYEQILKNGDKEKLIIEHQKFLQELMQSKEVGAKK